MTMYSRNCIRAANSKRAASNQAVVIRAVIARTNQSSFDISAAPVSMFSEATNLQGKRT